MTPILRPFALVLAPAVLAGGADQHTFAPAEGSRISVVYEQDFRVELVDMTVTMNGEEIDTSQHGIPEFLVHDSESLSFTDEFVTMGDGRPMKVLRTYDELIKTSIQEMTTPDGADDLNEDPGESELEGLTIAFDWNADDGEYVPSFTDEEADDELLDDLELHGYLWDVLPAGEVEEGDSWELDVQVFDAITEPCGDVDFVMESEEYHDDDDEWTEQFSDNLDGDFYAEYRGLRDEDGTEVAVYRLEAEVTTEIDQEEEADEGEGEFTYTRTTFSTFSFDFVMEGELLWDVAAKRPYALHFAGDVDFQIENDTVITHSQGEMEQNQVQYFEGTVEVIASYD